MSIKLRRKKVSGGKQSLYLDIYHNGQRRYEFLKLYLEKNKAENKEILKLAENIRAKREIDLVNSAYGFTASFKQRACFVQYFQKLVKSQPKGDSGWRNCLVYLKTFTNGTISFAAVTTEWLESFKSYLLSN